MKCSKCGAKVNACSNPECINRCQNSNGLGNEYPIYCDAEHDCHYCESDCLVDEFRRNGMTGEESELLEEDESKQSVKKVKKT
jgi:hypothetical protein